MMIPSGASVEGAGAACLAPAGVPAALGFLFTGFLGAVPCGLGGGAGAAAGVAVTAATVLLI